MGKKSALHHARAIEPQTEIRDLNRHLCLGLYSTNIFTAQFCQTLPGFYGDAVRAVTQIPQGSHFELQLSWMRSRRSAKNRSARRTVLF